MNIRERWRKTTLANKSLVVIGAIAASFTAGQLWILKSSGDVGSAQTTRLIETETRIASSMETAIRENRKAIEIAARENRQAIASSDTQNAAIVRSSNDQSRAALQETQRLRNDAVQQRIETVRPLIVFEVSGPYRLAIKNIGRGPALDIELRISKVTNGGELTNLRNLITQFEKRDFLNLGERDRTEIGGTETVRDYAIEPPDSHTLPDAFVVIAAYVDIDRRPYYSASLVSVVRKGAEGSLILKSTKSRDYKSGNFEKLDFVDMAR